MVRIIGDPAAKYMDLILSGQSNIYLPLSPLVTNQVRAFLLFLGCAFNLLLFHEGRLFSRDYYRFLFEAVAEAHSRMTLSDEGKLYSSRTNGPIEFAVIGSRCEPSP